MDAIIGIFDLLALLFNLMFGDGIIGFMIGAIPILFLTFLYIHATR